MEEYLRKQSEKWNQSKKESTGVSTNGIQNLEECNQVISETQTPEEEQPSCQTAHEETEKGNRRGEIFKLEDESDDDIFEFEFSNRPGSVIDMNKTEKSQSLENDYGNVEDVLIDDSEDESDILIDYSDGGDDEEENQIQKISTPSKDSARIKKDEEYARKLSEQFERERIESRKRESEERGHNILAQELSDQEFARTIRLSLRKERERIESRKRESEERGHILAQELSDQEFARRIQQQQQQQQQEEEEEQTIFTSYDDDDDDDEGEEVGDYELARRIQREEERRDREFARRVQREEDQYSNRENRDRFINFHPPPTNSNIPRFSNNTPAVNTLSQLREFLRLQREGDSNTTFNNNNNNIVEESDHEIALRLQREYDSADREIELLLQRERGPPTEYNTSNMYHQLSNSVERLLGTRQRRRGRRNNYNTFDEYGEDEHDDDGHDGYERLLQLASDIGTVSRGTSKSTIDHNSLEFTIKDPSKEVPKDCEKCMVCLEEWKIGDRARRLNCMHCFHVLCIDKWLENYNAICPICREPIKISEQRRRNI